MTNAARKGFATDDLDDAAKAAIGLSKAMGGDLNQALYNVTQATQGNFDAFQVFIPGINEMISLDEKLAAVSRLASDGLKLKMDSANSGVEATDRFNISLGNLREGFGSLLAPIRDVSVNGLGAMADLINQALVPAIEDFDQHAKDMADDVGTNTAFVAESFIEGFTIAEVAVFRFSDVLDFFRASLTLQMHQIGEEFKHLFTVAIPAYIATPQAAAGVFADAPAEAAADG
jgi:hypothetical protein